MPLLWRSRPQPRQSSALSSREEIYCTSVGVGTSDRGSTLYYIDSEIPEAASSKEVLNSALWNYFCMYYVFICTLYVVHTRLVHTLEEALLGGIYISLSEPEGINAYLSKLRE